MKHAAETGNRHITTPIHTYRHKPSGKQVTLVGVRHVAQNPDYYPTIQGILDSASDAGAAVHYERLKPSTPDEVRAAQPAYRYLQRIRRIRALASLPYQLFEGLNLIKQADAITSRDDWENHDASIIELARNINGAALFTIGGVAKALIGAAAKYLEPEDRLRMLTRIDPEQSSDATSLLFAVGLGSGIVDYRNGIALTAYDQLQAAEPGRDAALLWGAGHLPGLGEGLDARGFDMIDEQRLLAVDLDALAVVEA